MKLLVSERSTADLGYIGETYVIAKLICDYNIVSVKVPQQFFSYDLITNNNKRLEVKTARPISKEKRYKKKTYKWLVWQFTRQPRQIRPESLSNFVVCVAFESQELSETPLCFIIPSDKLVNPKTRKPLQVWSIKKKPKTRESSKYWEYKNRWDLITNKDNKKAEMKSPTPKFLL